MVKRCIGGFAGTYLCLFAMLAPVAAQDRAKRLVLSIVEAHDKYVASLKPDMNQQFYCLQAFAGSRHHLNGNKPVWYLHMASDSGVRFTVTVPSDVDGKATISSQVSAPQLHPDVKSLTELESLIASHRKLPKQAEIRQGDGIVVQYRTRKFSVHEVEPSGDYSHVCREVIGPQPDGFVMRVREVNRGEAGRRQYPSDATYWLTARRFFPGFTPESELLVEIDYAKNTQALEMFGAVGTDGSEYPAPTRPSLLLPEACKLALSALSESEREHYNVKSVLARSLKYTDERTSEWDIRLAAEDGDTIQIELDRDGKLIERQYRPWPSETKPKIKSVAEAEKVIPELLKSLNVLGTVKREGNKLSLGINPRTLKVHPEIEDGVYAEETEEVSVPGLGGYLLTIEEVEFAGELKTRLAKDDMPWLDAKRRGPFNPTKFVCIADDERHVLIVEAIEGADSQRVTDAFFGRFELWKP